MRSRLATALVSAGLGMTALAACGEGKDEVEGAPPAPNIVQPGAPGQPSKKLTPAQLAAIERTTYTAADVAFMQGMIHHHAQAILMSGRAATHDASPAVRELSARIIVAR